MSCPSQKKSTASPSDWMDGPSIEPLQLEGNADIVGLIDHVFARSGFNARRLAEAAHLYSRMLRDDTMVALTMAGAMTPIGMSGVVNSLIKAGFVDVIISTGANLYHDLHRPYDYPMVQGDPHTDDNALADEGIARIYDVLIEDADTLMATDEVILRGLEHLDYSKPFSSAALHHKLGHAVIDGAPQPHKSLLATATEYDVPIYTSSPGDSSIGMNLIVPHLLKKEVQLSPVLDVIETAALVRSANTNGVVILGGGSPKNFYLQTQPTLHQILRDTSKGGHDYFIQLTIDSPHWGGLSGATPQEARSWGKIKDAEKGNVVCYSCTSLSFPLIAQYILSRNEPRQPKRLYSRLEQITAELLEVAKTNDAFVKNYERLYSGNTKA